MQVSTFAGLAVGVLIVGYTAGEALANLYDHTLLLLVVGGGIAATLVSYPLHAVLAAFGAARRVFAAGGDQPRELIERMVTYAEMARREGILTLEESATAEPNPFLAAGMELIVDGAEPRLITDLLETELNCSKQRHANDERVLERLGQHWALFGAVGGLLALVQGGGGVAVGPPLLYGALLYGLIGGAFARKLGQHHAKEQLLGQMIIEGVAALQAGDNPRIIQYKLAVFLAPENRPTGAELPQPLPQSMPPTPDISAEEVQHYVEAGRERMLAALREAIDQSDGEREERKAASAFLKRAERGEFGIMALLASLGPELHQAAMEGLQRPTEPPTTLLDAEMLEGGALERELDFASLGELEDRQIQMLLREIDQRDAVIALKGASVAVREKILGNMSERVRGFLTEELNFIHCGPHDVLDAQSRVVRQLYRILGDYELD